MKKILFFLLLSSPLFGQIKVHNLPTTTTGVGGDYIIKDDSIGTPGSTKKISVRDFMATYLKSVGNVKGSGIKNNLTLWLKSDSLGNSVLSQTAYGDSLIVPALVSIESASTNKARISSINMGTGTLYRSDGFPICNLGGVNNWIFYSKKNGIALDIIEGDSIGIGLDTLHAYHNTTIAINDTLKYKRGTVAAGNVLTSDANGKLTIYKNSIYNFYSYGMIDLMNIKIGGLYCDSTGIIDASPFVQKAFDSLNTYYYYGGTVNIPWGHFIIKDSATLMPGGYAYAQILVTKDTSLTNVYRYKTIVMSCGAPGGVTFIEGAHTTQTKRCMFGVGVNTSIHSFAYPELVFQNIQIKLPYNTGWCGINAAQADVFRPYSVYVYGDSAIKKGNKLIALKYTSNVGIVMPANNNGIHNYGDNVNCQGLYAGIVSGEETHISNYSAYLCRYAIVACNSAHAQKFDYCQLNWDMHDIIAWGSTGYSATGGFYGISASTCPLQIGLIDAEKGDGVTTPVWSETADVFTDSTNIAVGNANLHWATSQTAPTLFAKATNYVINNIDNKQSHSNPSGATGFLTEFVNDNTTQTGILVGNTTHNTQLGIDGSGNSQIIGNGAGYTNIYSYGNSGLQFYQNHVNTYMWQMNMGIASGTVNNLFSYGALAEFGTHDNYGLLLRTNNVTGLAITTSQKVAIDSEYARPGSSSVLQVHGDIACMNAGNGLRIPSGTNATVGTATLTAGTVTVSTTKVATNSLIFISHGGTGTTANFGILSVGTITAGTSFVINSSNLLDNDTVNWWIINQP